MVDGTRDRELERRLEEQDKRVSELNETISHGIEKIDKRMEGIEGTLKAILEVLGSKSSGGTDIGKVPMDGNRAELPSIVGNSPVQQVEVKGEDPGQQVEEVVGNDPVQQVEEEGGDVVQQIKVEGGDPVQQVEVQGDNPVKQVELDFNAKEEENTCETKLYSLEYNKSYEVIKMTIQYIKKAVMFFGAIAVYSHKLWSRDNGAKGDHQLSPRREEDQNTSGRPRSVSQPLSPHDEHNNNLRSLSQNPSQSYRNHGARGDHYSSRQQSRSISPLSDRYHNSPERPRSFSPPLSQRSSSQRESYQSPYDGSYVRDRSASSWRNSRSPSGSLSRSYREHGAWGNHYSSRRSISPYSDRYRNSFRRPSSFSPRLSQRASSQRPYADRVRDRSVGSWRNSRSPPGSPPRSYRDHGAWGDHYPRQQSRSISPCRGRYSNFSRRPRSVSPSLSQRSSSQRDSYQSPYDNNYSPARSASSWRETRSPSRSPSRSYRDHGSRGTISRHANNQVREAVVRVDTMNIMSASFQQAGEENENPTLISISMLQSSMMEARFSDPLG